MFKNLKYHLLMHLIIFVWGFTGILGKVIALEFYQIVFFRVLIAGLSLLLFLLATGQKIRLSSRRDLLKVIGVGIIVSLHWLTFFKAIQVSTVSLGVLCLSTTTLHVTWLEPIVMKRKFLWSELWLGILVIFGIAFVAGNVDPSQHEGIFWGLLSALLAAFFSVFNLRLNKDGISSSSITVYEMFTGFFLIGIWLISIGKVNALLFEMTWSDFYWLLFLGIVCTSAAFMLMIEVVNKIGAFSASLSINLEPVYTIILAIFILNENQELSNRFYLGAFFIVVIVFLNPILKYFIAKRSKKSIE
jgi:drug/metabolite transporter (DMT)-like permease